MYVPTWRYYYNATAPPNLLPLAYPDLGIYHGIDVPMVFGIYPPWNVTATEYALSKWFRHAWASFAKNPEGGPGWNSFGSGPSFFVQDGSSNPTAVKPAPFDLDLGVIGGDGGVAGIRIGRDSDIDSKCGIFMPVYEALATARGDGF
jgi:hypothetical protein